MFTHWHALLAVPALIALSAQGLSNEHTAHPAKSDPAWNGYTPPGTADPAPFTPYYVPDGAKSYDSASRLVHYKGTWADAYSSSFVGHSSRRTRQPGASFYASFTGTGVEWFGGTGPEYGAADVYIDGRLVDRVDSYSKDRRFQLRRFWVFGLEYRKHTLKVVNAGKRGKHGVHTTIDVDALVIYHGVPPPKQQLHQSHHHHPPPSHPLVEAAPVRAAQASPPPLQGWQLEQKGTTGVSAMQLAIISSTHAIIVDKVEHNPLTIDNLHPAWATLYNLDTHALTPLHVKSNSFCAGGAFLGNGTLVNVGGNPIHEDHTASADFDQTDGMQSVRLFESCETVDAAGCDIYEYPDRIRLSTPRWYPSVVRLQDGSVMIIGGSKRGGWINNATTNNPTIEYFPPKNIHGANGTPIHLQFLVDTLNSNLFPIAFLLPDGRVFIAANRDAMIYDWKSNTETRLPRLPNGVRVTYPMTGTGILLPLVPENDHAPEVLICGGSTLDDTKPAYEMSAKDPASDQCARLLLTPEGIERGWQVEQMPYPRMMPDAVLLPTGAVVIVNGAASGISGYKNVRDQVGMSNADNPVGTPVLYNPAAPVGKRFTLGLPESAIPRMYHSTATLTPNGVIMIAGSNPNLDRSEVAYGTEYRVEWLRPPYVTRSRPVIDEAPRAINFGETVKVLVKIPDDLRNEKLKVAVMDFAYVTHATHTNSRLVYLVAAPGEDEHTVTVTGPPNGNVYPPGPGWLHVIAGDVPSRGIKILVGSGESPPVDYGAIENLLKTETKGNQEVYSKEG
ncbi:copper radical oxidase [Russula earlei]|uniref:Copper radical oxidase n=1 Tax=Russula earlei TaxID=71964 RepID=A0ACC0UEA4_9AGAM|nr:copper radical oxidase [Russula earlei]